MLAAEWWGTCDDPLPMLGALDRAGAAPAAFRRISLACCRRVTQLLPSQEFRDALALVEAWSADRLPERERVRTLEVLDQRLLAMPGRDEGRRSLAEAAGYRAALAVYYSLWTDPRRNHGNREGVEYVLSHVEGASAAAAGVDELTQPAEADRLVNAERAAQAAIIRAMFSPPGINKEESGQDRTG